MCHIYRDKTKDRQDRQDRLDRQDTRTATSGISSSVPVNNGDSVLEVPGGPAAEAERERKEEKRRRKEEERRRKNEERMRSQARPGSIWDQIRTGGSVERLLL